VQGSRCGTCHRLGERGSTVGPDLTGIVARMGRKRMLESLLQPDKEIGLGFTAYATKLDDGRVLSGLPVGLVDGDSRERILTADGTEMLVPVREITCRDDPALSHGSTNPGEEATGRPVHAGSQPGKPAENFGPIALSSNSCGRSFGV